jgi:hypothetical protein
MAPKLRLIVDELFARSEAGVFAVLHDDNKGIKLLPRPLSRWSLNLGLAARLQTAPLDFINEPSRSRGLQTTEELTQPYPPLEEQTSLATVTTDHLLSELYRRSEDKQWVLGLFRPPRHKGIPWEGLCWNGKALVCSGLASGLVEYITSCVIEHQGKHRSGDATLADDLAELFQCAFVNANASPPCRTFLSGVCAMASVHAGSFGGRKQGGPDLASFVRID